MPRSHPDQNLQTACHLTGSEWATRLSFSEGPTIEGSFHVNKAAKRALISFLAGEQNIAWLKGCLVSNFVRSKNTLSSQGFSTKRIYAFPDNQSQRVILVGANNLGNSAKRVWRILVSEGTMQVSPTPQPDLKSAASKLQISYHLPEAIYQALLIMEGTLGSQAGWLAIRSGEFLEIRSCSNAPGMIGERIPIEGNSLLRDILRSRKARYIEPSDEEWSMVPVVGNAIGTRTWVGQPLVIGRRVIGLVGLWVKKRSSPEDMEKLEEVALEISPAVEGSVIFSDLSDYLRRMALLNDIAVTVSSAVDVDRILKRFTLLLKRAFSTDRIFLMIYSIDRKELFQYCTEGNDVVAWTVPFRSSPWLERLLNGDILQIDTRQSPQEYISFFPDTRSALVVPLKFQQQVIGSIGLESPRDSYFSIYDQHLLSVIASHLTGLIENNRLRKEAEARAHNLGLIHDVVENTIGKVDIQDVSRISARLLAQNFAYEFVGIYMIDQEKLVLMAGTTADGDVARPLGSKIESHLLDGVIKSGQSMVSNPSDAGTVESALDVGSEMCVALKDSGKVFGAIVVQSRKPDAFSQSDLMVLESLAGILSGVFSNADHYRRLQSTVDQLERARTELQERINSQEMAEKRLLQAAKLAAVGEMAAGIAHELNNPLTTIAGFAELVLEEIPQDDDKRADLELILKESQRTRSVVRRLLDFARQADSNRTRCDLSEIIEDVLSLSNHLLRTAGVMTNVSLERNLPWISVDRNQIKQVLLNLIHNAMHAMPSGGVLTLSTAHKRHQERDGICVSLKDTGVGMSAEIVDRLFEPFFTTRSMEGGTGLGLSVSYGIIMDHGGDIFVESEIGKGSTFTVWFPEEGNK